MYRFQLNGCLTTILLILLIFFLIKQLWWVFVGIILVLIITYYSNLIYNTLKEQKRNERINYNPQMGEVFKICPFCNAKVKVTEKTCPVCGHALN